MRRFGTSQCELLLLEYGGTSSDSSANVLTSTHNTDRATRVDFYDLDDLCIALLASSVSRFIRTYCELKLISFATFSSLYVTKLEACHSRVLGYV